jgi:hypothetical protein
MGIQWPLSVGDLQYECWIYFNRVSFGLYDLMQRRAVEVFPYKIKRVGINQTYLLARIS